MAIDILQPVGLIVPDEHEPVRNRVLTNGLNQDKLDGLIGSMSLQNYAPVFSSEVGTDQPNIGDTGLVEGAWVRVFGLIYVWVRVLWSGSGIAPGTGSNYFNFSLPVAAHPDLVSLLHVGSGWISRSPIIGSANLRDNSSIGTNTQTGAVQLRSSTAAVIASERGNSSRVISGDVPFTWADNDRISLNARYRGIDT